MTKELTIYCDESTVKGKHFSDFYGGVVVGSNHIDEVKRLIAAKKKELNLLGEVKWTKITENYAAKYIELVDLVFSLLAEKKIRIRIMFTQNLHKPLGLTKEHAENKYFLLYYQFIKNAFGFRDFQFPAPHVSVRVYLDKMPDTEVKIERFRNFVSGLTNDQDFIGNRVVIHNENVTEVTSHEHDLLQCLDVILGSIQFRLNDLHKEIPSGKRRRGKRTVAKEKVYKHISSHIRKLKPGFNIGISTGAADLKDRWRHPYRHWLFVPKNFEFDQNAGKKVRTP